MNYLDHTMPTPAENLACDETLLDQCEDGCGDEILRFWESPEYFVVVGYGNRVDAEVNRAACESRKVPILRRCSGGGTVLQGPGCLNYSLILRMDNSGPLGSISSTNRFIMERNRQALEALTSRSMNVQGHTDLALDDLKFSGNAQRRKKRALLFHGSFLLDFNVRLIEELLLMPTIEPGYRRHRRHQEFLTQLEASAESVKESVRNAWGANEWSDIVPCDAIQALASHKYVTSGWNFKF